MIVDDKIGLQPRDLSEGRIFKQLGRDVLAEIAHALFGKIQKRTLPLRHHLFWGVVPGAVPPSLDEINLGLRRGVVVGEAAGKHGREKWTP